MTGEEDVLTIVSQTPQLISLVFQAPFELSKRRMERSLEI